MLRYITGSRRATCRSTHSMIPLGSCTMKLNATTEMLPVTWPEFGQLHPFAPAEQTAGYRELFARARAAGSREITGFAAVSLQPNAGSQGEYAGLLVIRAYHERRGEAHRNVCLIPTRAHGTNPAARSWPACRSSSSHCDEHGNIDLARPARRRPTRTRTTSPR